jgi:dienelactone hydrolase
MSLIGRIGTQLGSALDGALVNAARLGFARHTGPRQDRSRLLAEATEFYRRPELLAGDGFFPPPEVARPLERRVRTLDGGEVVDVTFPSTFRPRWERMERAYLEHAENATAHVRMLRHTSPRASILCLHGYAGGRQFFSERAFEVEWLYKLGLDVSLFVLPFHGARAAPGTTAPIWPSPHVARTNEGFAHAMHDLRAWIAWLRARGAPQVAVTGMSLGGFTTSLLATVEPLDFAAPMIPVAAWADLFWTHGQHSRERAEAEAEGITLERMRAALEVTSPLARAPKLPGERVLVIDAAGDRIAPRQHAAWLADHFRARRVTFGGGHVLQLGRGKAFRALARRFAELELIPPRAP